MTRICALLFVLGFLVAAGKAGAGPRLNELQVIGTHNSYHIAPHPSLAEFIRGSRGAEVADTLAYTHRSLTEQLERLGIRQLELDLYADPDGNRFALPKGIDLARERGITPAPSPDPEEMRRPGAKIMHVPDFDFQSNVPSLRAALQELRAWSDRNPAHVPVMIMLELKSGDAGPLSTPTLPWTAGRLDALESEIRDFVPEWKLVTPDFVRGTNASLREAVLTRGWPEIAEVRGRFLFALDNTDEVRDRYLARSAHLEGRLLFPSVEESHAAAAWFKINDPVADFDRIQRLVKAGFMVRTRADADLTDARRRNFSRRDRAFASGAQFVSTDFPEPQPSLGSFVVQWPGGVVARPNPVSAPRLEASLDLEELGIAALSPFARRELDLLNQRGFAFHLQRRLAEASALYDRLLALDPARNPTSAQRRRALDLAPVLRRVEGEPFDLEACVAIHHPSESLIAYHLFWDDDIDFPEDNDPTDHEVVWVRYEEATGKPTTLYAYFHGRILEAPSAGGRPAFAVEWGKHGSLPFASADDAAPRHLEVLAGNWKRLSERGTRLPEFPLARHWPKRFDGDLAAYGTFTRELPTSDTLASSGLVFVSRWGNATINRHALPYNFAAKVEWPGTAD